MDFEALEAIRSGFVAIADTNILLIMSAGVVGGIVIGTLPGLSSVMAITLMLPVAISLGPVTGLALLGAIYSAALYGGANSAILLNTPGTPSSLPTAFDGFPFTRKGEADFALYLALFASVFGGLFGTFVLMAAFVPLARLSLLFGPSEFFWLAMIGLSAIAAVSPGRLVQGFLSAGIGLFLTTVGQNVNTGNLRFTFGIYELAAGIGVIPVLLGVFSISQAMLLYETEGSIVAEHRFDKSAAGRAFRTLMRKTWLAVRASAIGTYVGILPGAGGAIASILAYNHARKTDRNPGRFGTGVAEGVLAPEASNNAQVSSSLVPMMGLGIPGNVNAAVIMGALLSFGIQPGINLVDTSGDIAFAFIASLVVANVLMLVIGMMMIPLTAQVLHVPNRFLGPGIMVLCIVGAYAAAFDLYGVWVAFASGLLGYLLIKFDVPVGPLALGVVLGPLAETGLSQSQQIGRGYGGVIPYMASQPISLLLAGFLAVAGGVAAFRFFGRSRSASEPVALPPASLAEICFFAVIVLGAASSRSQRSVWRLRSECFRSSSSR